MMWTIANNWFNVGQMQSPSFAYDPYFTGSYLTQMAADDWEDLRRPPFG